jgi:hypothetical protein
VATRKQRRRREKEKRHEYEIVYVDSEGNEVEPEEVEPTRNGTKQTARAKSGGKSSGGRSTRSGRPARTPKPPSWDRAFRRGGLWILFLFVFLAFVNRKNVSVPQLVVTVLPFALLIVPLTYYMDRMVWRMHQRRVGGASHKR